MQRYKCTVEYDGRPYHGWQYQDEVISVQKVFETAIEDFVGEFVRVYVSGRTDAGVHALGQVVHFDLPKYYPADAVMNAINHYLKPAPVAVKLCDEVSAASKIHLKSASTPKAGRSCIIRCATWSGHWFWLAKEAGSRLG